MTTGENDYRTKQLQGQNNYWQNIYRDKTSTDKMYTDNMELFTFLIIFKSIKFAYYLCIYS